MPPLEFRVPITAFPFFHPKDVPTLTEVVGIQNCKTYAYHAEHSDLWTITSLPMKIKADTKTVQLRSRDVTICPDRQPNHVSEGLSRKRTLSLVGSPERDMVETVRKKVSASIMSANSMPCICLTLSLIYHVITS